MRLRIGCGSDPDRINALHRILTTAIKRGLDEPTGRANACLLTGSAIFEFVVVDNPTYRKRSCRL